MVSVFVSSAVDCGFEPRSSQTKDPITLVFALSSYARSMVHDIYISERTYDISLALCVGFIVTISACMISTFHEVNVHI